MPVIWDEKHKTTEKQITIAPVTRLEGHAKINIFLDDDGNVEDTYFQVVELRGFEEFCKGRPAEEMPRIVTRLCGVCPWPHHLASSMATDKLFGVEPPSAARKLRELGYCAHMLESHLEHIYALGPAPDFVLGPASDPAKRNVFGVIEAVGLEVGRKVLQHRAYAVAIEDMIGGKSTHPVHSLAGGVTHPLTAEDVAEIKRMGEALVDFCEFTLTVVDDVVLKNKDYMDILLNKDLYYQETYYMGCVDDHGRLTFFPGKVRVVAPGGSEYAVFEPDDYLRHIAEHVEPWSYLKFPYLRNVGWKGLVDGPDSGVYRVAPLGRLNVATGMATPRAQKAYEQFYSVLGGKPVHHSLTYHWARAIECVYAAERIVELTADPEITSTDVRTIPQTSDYRGEGIGVIEAPRGILMHHYKADEEAMMTELNLIVASAHDYAGMNIDIGKVARGLIKNWEISPGILNMCEMGFRSYDPCFSCATHSLPGQTPMELRIFGPDKKLYRRITRGI
jgi:F420-non-reducing hydrogenase large subunit